MFWPCTTTLEIMKLCVQLARDSNLRVSSCSSFLRRYTPSYRDAHQVRHKGVHEISLLTKQLIATTSTPSIQVIALTEAPIVCVIFTVSMALLASTNLDRWFPASNKRILPADGSTSSPSKIIVPAAKYVTLFPSTVRSTTATEMISSSGSHAYELRSNIGITESIPKKA